MGKINNLNRKKLQSKKSLSYSSWQFFSSPSLTTSHCQRFKNNSETHVLMVHTLHEDQLPVCSLGVSLILKGSAELLNGHVSVKDSIICSTAEIEQQLRVKTEKFLGLLPT
jgi:hypothetical protein